MSTGTGGTIAGTGQYIKSMNEDVKIVLADPEGSGLFNKVDHEFLPSIYKFAQSL